MAKTTLVSVVGITLLLALALSVGTFSLAVRAGVIDEQIIWFPPNMRYQLVVRIGNDALPWDRRSGRITAINLWVHGRGTPWHIVNLVHLRVGETRESEN